MGIAKINIYVSKKTFVHVVAVRMRIVGREAHVLVQVERMTKREVEPFCLMHSHQHAADGFHGPTRGEAEDQMRVRAQFFGDDARHELRGGLRVWSDDDFHGAELNTKAPKRHEEKVEW